MRYNLEWRRAIRSDTPISIMMIDVDEFKRFNDFYGHQAGDQCLAAIGRALQGGVKRSADFVARYGGEEFVVLLPETATNGAEVVARHLLAAVKALKITHNQSSAGQVSVSIGIASLQPHFSDEPGVLLHAADAALYIAKREGRDQFRTAPESIATHE